MPLNALLFLLLLLLLLPTTIISSTTSTATLSNPQRHHRRHHHHKHNLSALCSTTPHPSACLSTLKLSISIDLSPFLSSALLSLRAAISSLSPLNIPSSISESHRGSLQDCSDLHYITLSSLRRSTGFLSSSSNLPEVKAHLSAALTNRRTCLDGLSGASGDGLPAFLLSLSNAYDHVTNALSLVSRHPSPPPRGRRLLGRFPYWLSQQQRRILQSGDGDGLTLTVAKDGTGNFTTVSQAVAFAPGNSNAERTFIWIKAGVYEENVDIPSDKVNIVFLGDGRDVTVIRGSRSSAGGWTSFRSATVGVSGQGFLARDITFENAAGVDGGQAAALRVNADASAFYRCTISSFQDTLYVHSFRQFYRECNVYGTIDFIFGNAAVVFQSCNLMARLPIKGQANVVTAQSRDDPNEDTGISIDRCSITAADDLAANPDGAKTYLGRPWMPYSRTVVMESFIDGLVDPAGWINWEGDRGLDTLYYGEYENNGAGSDTSNRVDWPGYHVMDYDDAVAFTVSQLIDGDDWLGDTSFPYDSGV